MQIPPYLLAAAVLTVLTTSNVSIAQSDEEPTLPMGLEPSETVTAPDESSLPTGLGEEDSTGPDLPAGLGDDEPDLPMGIGEAPEATEPPAAKETFADSVRNAGVSGFAELRAGVRTQNDPDEKSPSLGETRLQLEWRKDGDSFTLKYTGDLLYDQVDNSLGDIDLRRGRGFFDLREAWGSFTPLPWMDVKLGRQTFTWGTGDALFLNDLFPKDWHSFLIGRDLEFLKAPSDAVKISAYAEAIAIDFAYIPLMNPSRFISGRRLSYFNFMLGDLAGRNAIIQDDLPAEWFQDAEYATRLSRKIGSYELAAYGFSGFYKTPEGFDPARNRAFYPRLNTYGASIRGPVGRGIGNVEVAYYDSRDDRHGDNPFVPNSEVRLLAGYETYLPEIAKALNLGVQYYVEIMSDHGDYLRTLPPPQQPDDKARHVLTLRLTMLLPNYLTLGMLAYYSPTDNDAYLRPKVTCKINDDWAAEVGANIFLGERSDTSFGQFRRNTNIYASLRYSF